jgi:hypothetical protein
MIPEDLFQAVLSLFSRKDEPRPSANLARGTVILVRAVKVRRFEEPLWDKPALRNDAP